LPESPKPNPEETLANVKDLHSASKSIIDHEKKFSQQLDLLMKEAINEPNIKVSSPVPNQYALYTLALLLLLLLLLNFTHHLIPENKALLIFKQRLIN